MSQYPNETPPPEFTRPTEEAAPRGPGCLLPVVITLFLAFLLGGVAALLPPFSLLDRIARPQYVMLDAQNNAARTPDQNLTLILNPNDIGAEFGVSLNHLPQAALTDGSTHTLNAAAAALPQSLSLQSDLYTLSSTGTAPNRVTLTLTLPNGVASAQRTDVYGWHAAAREWQFIASQFLDERTLLVDVDTLPDMLAVFDAEAPSAPVMVVPIDVTETLTADVANVANIVMPAGLQPVASGELVGSLAAGIQSNAGYRIMPVIRNFVDTRALDTDTAVALIQDPARRRAHIQQIALFASTYDGVFIDYRALPADQRDNFSAFIDELAASLDARNLRLGVVVPAAENVSGAWETGAYDWQQLAQSADYLQVNLDRVDPAMFAPGTDRLVEAMLRWGVGEANRYKLLVGLSAQSQLQASGGFTPIGYAEALSPLGNVRISGTLTENGDIIPGETFSAELDGLAAEAGVDEGAQTPYLTYLDENGNPISRIWLTTDEALAYRLGRVAEFAVGGIALPDLANGDFASGILQTIVNHRLQLAAQPTTTDLHLRWRVEDSNGVLAEATTTLNEPLVATIEAPEGNYTVNVAVVAESVVERSGLSVALAAPTPTPTPLPSPTPRPTATPTPTPDPEAVALAQAQATQAAAAVSAPRGGSFGAVSAGAGSIQVGQFEYGGHVTDTRSARAANAMRNAGMTWMKIQIRYSPGAGTEEAANAINGAREQGFKILIGTVGSPQELAFAGDDYVRGYSEWLGRIAGLSPDAIEVWNEPNLDREWPRGQISGAAYANMLRQAYTAIKNANGGVIVISGAPAPTGAEAAFPGQVMNDDRFLREMVDAGALQYMDCVGLHYNEGIVPPDARSGDPRDNYYTRYLGTMLDTYWGITGGTKPICITELGYLSSEGYPSLPPFFSWAQNVTVAQQAAWLSQAAAISSQSGRVRIMIVWNVDFTSYGSDPQGGYAMIRPDGSCPACDAMRAAR